MVNTLLRVLCDPQQTTHSSIECIFQRPSLRQAIRRRLERATRTHPPQAMRSFVFNFLIKLLLFAVLPGWPGLRLIHIQFINSLHFINTQRHLIVSSHVAQRSLNCRFAGCTVKYSLLAGAWRLYAARCIHFLFDCRALVVVRACNCCHRFFEISYSSLEIDYFIGRNGIWQSGAPREMIMFVVWYFICRRHNRTKWLENCIENTVFAALQAASVWILHRHTHSLVETRSNRKS